MIKLTFIKTRGNNLPVYAFKNFEDEEVEKAKRWIERHKNKYFLVTIEVDGMEVVEL